MAGLKIEINANLSDFRKLITAMPSLRAEFLSKIGKRGRLTLKGSLLSGQELNITKDIDSKGRHTISNKVGKLANSVAIKSYPVNLFERGRMLRNGRKESGRRIITSKLKTLVDSNLQTWSNQVERETLDPEFDKA